jgi:hypothetical protein
MRWVEGLALNDFVRQQLDKPDVLLALAQIWAKMAARLREARLALSSTDNAVAIGTVDVAERASAPHGSEFCCRCAAAVVASRRRG